MVQILIKVMGTRKHLNTATNSNGIKAAWRYLKKNNFFGYSPCTEKQLGNIVRSINSLLRKDLTEGKTIVFPSGMGKVELVKKNRKLVQKNGKWTTNNIINWKETLNLWKQDSESKRNKTLVRYDNNEVFLIKYHRVKRTNNSIFYCFLPSKELRKKLKDNIQAGITDALINEDYGIYRN